MKSYSLSLTKNFKKQVENGLFSFLIVDTINDKTAHYQEMWSFAKQKGYEVNMRRVTVSGKTHLSSDSQKNILHLFRRSILPS